MSSLPHVAKATPQTCALDNFRIAIADQIVKVHPSLTIDQVFEGVHYGQKGNDYTVAMPRFRLKEKPDESCKKVVEAVCTV
jgi:arginyl-tRNA synthetase